MKSKNMGELKKGNSRYICSQRRTRIDNKRYKEERSSSLSKIG